MLLSDLVTVPPPFNVTETGVNKSADSSHTTSHTTELSTTDTSVAWITGVGTSVTNPGNVTITASFTTDSVTSSPATHTDPNNFHISTVSYGSTVLSSDTARNDIRSEESSTLGNSPPNSAKPGVTPTLSAGNATVATANGNNYLIYNGLIEQCWKMLPFTLTNTTSQG